MTVVGGEITPTELERRLLRIPRVELCQAPTPLHACPRLSEHVGRPVLLKREDLSGLAFGGNKARMLEYLLADALAKGADTIVAGAAAQSNFCRQLAAACARLGLRCILILRTVRGDADLEVQGNLFLDVLAGAEVSIHRVDGRAQAALVEDAAERVGAAGGRPYIPEHHASIGAIAYVACGLEMYRQIERQHEPPAAIYLAAAGETQAGLVLTQRLLDTHVPVVGFDPGVDWWDVPARVVRCANECATRLEVSLRLNEEDISNSDEMAGAGYGLPTQTAVAAIRLVAELEGVFLDPVYTGKAMAGLLAHAEQGRLPGTGPIVFMHTGGGPALFHYRDAFAEKSLVPGSPDAGFKTAV